MFHDRAPGGPVPRLLMRWVRRPLLPAVRLWRRNLQLRVVAGTLLMSLGVVLLLGLVVIGQVRNGLLEAKGKAAQTQAAGGFAAAQEKANAPLTPVGRAVTRRMAPLPTIRGGPSSSTSSPAAARTPSTWWRSAPTREPVPHAARAAWRR